MIPINSFTLPTNFHFTPRTHGSKWRLPVTLRDGIYVCVMEQSSFQSRVWGHFGYDRLKEPPLKWSCTRRTGFWLATESVRGAACADEVGCATGDSVTPLRPSDQNRVLATSSCHPAICPLHQRQFPFLSLGLMRSDNCHDSVVSVG